MRRESRNCLVSAAIVLSIACAMPTLGSPATSGEGNPGPGPILLVGVDGMEWDVVLPMIAAGRLPHLAAWIERGTYGELRSIRPTRSPIIWTSIATGMKADRHGIVGFVDPELEDRGEMRLFTSLDRRTKAFWNILSEHDRRTLVIGWWVTYPVEPIDGVMVAQTNTVTEFEDVRFGDRIWKGGVHADLERQVHPPERQREFLDLLPAVDRDLPGILREVFGEPPGADDPLAERLWSKCLWAFRADEIYRRVALHLLGQDRDDADLVAVYFGGPDVVGHLFWRYMEPEGYRLQPTPEQIERYGDFIRSYYAHIDRVIGELAAAAGPQTDLMVVSDHGMKAAHTDIVFAPHLHSRALNSGGHAGAPPGVFLAAGPSFRAPVTAVPPASLRREALQEIGTVFDVTPTLLAALGIPVGRDMVGEVLLDVLDPALVERRPIRRVDSHTPADWFSSRVSPPVEVQDTEERLEQLRALGYLGDGE